MKFDPDKSDADKALAAQWDGVASGPRGRWTAAGYHTEPCKVLAFLLRETNKWKMTRGALASADDGHDALVMFAAGNGATYWRGYAGSLPISNYVMTPWGLQYVVAPKKKRGEIAEGDYGAALPITQQLFTVIGTGPDQLTASPAIVLAFADTSGRRPTAKRVIVPRDVLARGPRDLAVLLERSDFRLAGNKRAADLLCQLLTELIGPRVLIPAQSGYVADGVFALPTGEVITSGDASDKVRVCYPPGRAKNVYVGKSGELERWQSDVAAPCKGNSRLILSLAAAVVGPLMPYATGLGTKNTILNLYDDSSTGKTTAGFVCGSVWGGNPERTLRYGHSWRMTDNEMELVASAHTGTVVVFDEFKHCKNPGTVAYQFSEGEAKGRMTANIESRFRLKWSCFGFSTGERTLDELVIEQDRGASINSGTEVRVIDLMSSRGGVNKDGSPMGVVERLNGFASSSDLISALDLATNLDYGHAGPEFVRQLFDYIEGQKDGEAGFRAELRRHVDRFVVALDLPAGTNGAITRVARVFGLLAYAATLLAHFEVVPIPADEMVRGVRKCFTDWFALRGSNKSKADVSALIELRNYLLKNQGSFASIDGADARGNYEEYIKSFRPLAGYRKGTGSARRLLIMSSTWDEIKGKAKRANIAKVLHSMGLLEKQPGQDGYQYKLCLPDKTKVNVYSIDARILSMRDSGEFDDEDTAALATQAARLVNDVAPEERSAMKWLRSKAGASGEHLQRSAERTSAQKH